MYYDSSHATHWHSGPLTPAVLWVLKVVTVCKTISKLPQESQVTCRELT